MMRLKIHLALSYQYCCCFFLALDLVLKAKAVSTTFRSVYMNGENKVKNILCKEHLKIQMFLFASLQTREWFLPISSFFRYLILMVLVHH